MATDLNKVMILQPSTQSATLVGKSTARFEETWKGPWDEIRKLTKESKIFGVTLIVGIKRPNFPAAKWIQDKPAPEPLNNVKWPWVIMSLDIQEGVGEQGILTISYESGEPEWSIDEETGYPENDETKDLSSYERTESRAWSITWQPFNRSVLEYSAIPDDQIKLKEWPASGKGAWWYCTNSAKNAFKEFTRDEKERAIAGYYASDISPQFHYPVVTLHQEYVMPQGKKVTDIGAMLDRKTTLPSECPWTGPDSWEWIMVSDSGQIKVDKKMTFTTEIDGETKQVTETTEIYTRDTSWQGAKKWDNNFYGPNPWKPVLEK